MAERMPTGTILIRDSRTLRSGEEEKTAVIYARINARQESSLMSEQIDLCGEFCAARGWTITPDCPRDCAGGWLSTNQSSRA